MNTEKLEKLKKSLDNQFIPDNMKDKIRAEIKKLEADIKTDDTITATEVKEEVKEIEKKVEKALEVAEKKEEQAEAKAPAKTRTKRTTTSRTKKPKVEEKPTAKKKTFTAIAKEIRKAGESWEDAKLRARKMMKSETTEIKKKTRTETDKLLAMVRRNKEYKKLAGTSNLSKDAQRRAMPRGKRVSTKGWKNQYGESDGGKVYYENRANRVDVGGFKSAYLETGGGVDESLDEIIERLSKEKGYPNVKLSRSEYEEVLRKAHQIKYGTKYADGGGVGKKYIVKGDGVINTHTNMYVDYDFRTKQNAEDFANHRNRLFEKYGIDFAVGGTIIGTPETPLARDLGISYTGLVGETGAMSSGEMFAGGGQITISEIKRRTSETSPYFFDAKTMKFFNQKMSDFKVRKLENGKYEIYAPRKDYNGKSMGVTKRIFNPETNELEFTKDFATGGGVDKWIGYDKDHLMNMKNGMIVLRGTDLKDIKPKDIKGFDMLDNRGYADGGYLTDPNFGDFQAGVYADGGSTGLPAGTEQHFVNYYLGEGTAQGIYARGGGVKKRSLKSVIHLVDWKGEGIKKWYLRSYPTDEMGEELNDTVTFKDLWDSLNAKKNVYEIMGVGDSLIRERLFEYLSLIYNVDYDVVYNKWLDSDDYAKGGGVRMVGGREYPTGRAWTNEHRHIDKADSREVNYTRKKSFDDGGELEDKMQYGSWYVNIKEDENDEESRNQEVARLIREGYFSGFDPSWYLEITDIEGDIDEATEQEIARLVEQGYTSGEVVMYKDSYAKGGGVGTHKYTLSEAKNMLGAEKSKNEGFSWFVSDVDYYGEDDNEQEYGVHLTDKELLDLADEVGDNYAKGGETYNEKASKLKGGVDYYSVDIDLDNGDEIRDLSFKSLDKAKKEYLKYSESMVYDNEDIMDVQLLVVYKNGDYDNIYLEEDDNYAKGGGVSPFKNMMETNTITEKEINLIKLRMNNDKVDEYTQEAIDFIWDNSPQLTSDQNKKGIDYLRNLWKSPTGKERTNNPFGYREQDALETFEYFELRGFYDAGNRYRKFYVPLYTCVGAETSFEYYISGGEINIVG